MKNIIPLIFLSVCLRLEAQPKLYCTTSSKNGTISKYDGSANTLDTVHAFQKSAILPTKLIKIHNGKIYGTSMSGGMFNDGTIFSFDPISKGFEIVHHFNGEIDGSRGPAESLIEVNGKLYGMAGLSGNPSCRCGTIYSFDIETNVFSRLFTFDQDLLGDGDLAQGPNGILYGVATRLGSVVKDVIFSFRPSSKVYNVVHEFTGPDGAFGSSGLVYANNGKLYGTMRSGGNFGQGVIFTYNPGTNSFSKIFDFNGANGQGPGLLSLASDGKFYGSTGAGGSADKGVIFSVDPGSDYTFIEYPIGYNEGLESGRYPKGGLLQGSDGKIYGITGFGGTNDRGVIFSFNPLTRRTPKNSILTPPEQEAFHFVRQFPYEMAC